MEAFKVRLINEQFELCERLEKLISYIGTPKFNELTEEQRILLCNQQEAMEMYNSILIKRLKQLGIN